MCDPLSLAIGAAAVTAGGTFVQYQAGQDAASAANQANQDAIAAQSQAFNTRLTAQNQQLADQTRANDAASQRFQQSQTQQQDAQTRAQSARGNLIDQTNQQEQAIATGANNSVSQALASTSPQALADAQTNQVQTQQALNTPVVQALQANNPLGAAGTNSQVTKDALDSATTGAGKYVQNYGDTLAKLSGYSAPVTAANQASTTLGTNLMPAGAADELLKSSAPALLAPSTLAYQQAGAYGDAQRANSNLTLGNDTTLAQTRKQNAANLADLTQQDTNANTQTKLGEQQQAAAGEASLGSGLSSLGSLGLNIAGANGAFKPAIAKAKALIS